MNAFALAALWLTVALPMLLMAGLLSADSEVRRPVRASIVIAVVTLLVAFPLSLVLYSLGHASITYTPGTLSPFPALAAREHRLLVRPLKDALTPRGESRSSLLWRDEQGGLLHCVNGLSERVFAYDVTRIEYRQAQTFLQALLNDDPDLAEVITVRVAFQSGEEAEYQVRRSRIGLLLGPFPMANDYGYPDRIVGPASASRTDSFSCLPPRTGKQGDPN